MSFKVGDTVSLKSGGPDMTITRIGTAGGEPMIWCVWFEGTKDVYGLFPPEALKAPPELAEARKAPPEPAQVLESAEVEAPSEPQLTEADSAHPAKENDKSLEAQIASVQALIANWIKRP